MARFIRKILLFCTPFMLLVAFIYVIDPFCYFGDSNFISHDLKQRISSSSNGVLWKIVAYSRNPKPNILLGDSRTDALNTNRICEVAGEDYSNLAFGGETLAETIETFWFAAAKTRLKNVYIGLNFNVYNEYNDKHRFLQAAKMIENPLLYFKDITILKSCYYLVCEKFFHKKINLYEPKMNKDDFWRYQLEVFTTRNYSMYKYPKKDFNELAKMADYCTKNGINLVFIVYPTHTDLQGRVRDFHLVEQELQFKNDIRSLAVVYDFDYPCQLTSDKTNFADPYHNSVPDLVIREVWGHEPRYARCSTGPSTK